MNTNGLLLIIAVILSGILCIFLIQANQKATGDEITKSITELASK